MRELNIQFLDLYKRVDNFLRDAYASQEGVSEYIRQMEKIWSTGLWKVHGWNSKYETLKRLRWIRNRLSHDVDCDADICTDADYNALAGFDRELRAAEDPLAVLHKYLEERKRQMRLQQQNSRDARVERERLERKQKEFEEEQRRRAAIFSQLEIDKHPRESVPEVDSEVIVNSRSGLRRGGFFMKKIEPFSIKFGTPKPVPFVERYEMPGVAVDVAGRIAGQVDVSECDRKAFTSGQDPAAELKSMMPQLISVAFAKMSETSVVKNIEERAARELESLMAERGITAKVKIVSFLLTEESEKTLKAALGIDDNRNEVFRTSFRAEVQPDREELERDIGSVRREVYEVPREAFLGEVNYRFRPAAVPEGSTEKSQEMPLKSDSERPLEQAAGKPVARFCSRCGARRNPAARFCVKCGAKFED